jgi:hypothetical protein
VGKLAGNGKRCESEGSLGTGRKPPTEIKNFGAFNDGCGGNEGWAFWFISCLLAPAHLRGVLRGDERRTCSESKGGYGLEVGEGGTYKRREDGGHTCSL